LLTCFLSAMAFTAFFWGVNGNLFRAWTFDGEKLEFECAGMLARVVQHELDHLDGICFVDRLTPQARREIERDLNRLVRHGGKSQYRKGVIV